MHKEAEVLLSLGLPVWVSCYIHNIGFSNAHTNLRAIEVIRENGRWVSTKGRHITVYIRDTDIQPTREEAIAHYNQSIDNCLASMHRIVDELAPSLMKKKYKV